MSNVDHPDHYGGADNPYEAIKVIEAWGLGFHLGNAVKYIARAGLKNPDTEGEDLDKAIWYIQRYLELEFEKLRKESDEAPDSPKPEVTRYRDVDGDSWFKQPDGTWDWEGARPGGTGNFLGWTLERLRETFGPLEEVSD